MLNIYIEKIKNIKKLDIFDIFDNIAIFFNPGSYTKAIFRLLLQFCRVFNSNKYTFLDVVVTQRAPILQLLSSKDQTLLIRWNT